MATSRLLIRQQVAVAAEEGSPPSAGCGDAVVPRDCQGGRKGPPEVSEERVGAEVDASLRLLARAVLALAEQLQREEGP